MIGKIVFYFIKYAKISNDLLCRSPTDIHKYIHFIRDDNKHEVARNSECTLPSPIITGHCVIWFSLKVKQAYEPPY